MARLRLSVCLWVGLYIRRLPYSLAGCLACSLAGWLAGWSSLTGDSWMDVPFRPPRWPRSASSRRACLPSNIYGQTTKGTRADRINDNSFPQTNYYLNKNDVPEQEQSNYLWTTNSNSQEQLTHLRTTQLNNSPDKEGHRCIYCVVVGEVVSILMDKQSACEGRCLCMWVAGRSCLSANLLACLHPPIYQTSLLLRRRL